MPCTHDWTEGGATVTLAASLASGLIRKRVPAERRRPKLPLSGLGFADAVGETAVETEGLERVARLVDWLRPGLVCMVGLEGWRAATDRRATAGWQERQLGTRPVYVMPSTSGLNAGTSMAALVDHLRSALAGPLVR